MLLKIPLSGAVLGVIIAQVDAKNSKCFSTNTVGEDNYKACCPEQWTSGRGDIDGTMFNYTCGTYAIKTETCLGENVSTAKECAQAIAADPKWNSGFWESDPTDCCVFESITPSRIKDGPPGYLFIQKTRDAVETPDPAVECKDPVEAAKGDAKSKCEIEKNQLVQEGELVREKERVDCQVGKDKSIAAAKSECDSAHENLRTEAKTQLEKAQAQYDTEKNELREKCQNDKEAAAAAAKNQCNADKNELGEKCQSDKETAIAVAVALAKDQCDTDKNQLDEKCQSDKDAAAAAAKDQCNADKNELGEKCQSDKGAAVAAAKNQCDTDKNKLDEKYQSDKEIAIAAAVALAKDQCDTDKNQLRKEGVDNLQQRESQCEARISALEKANGSVDEASKQCETDKSKLLQETTDVKKTCDADKAALLGQIKELEKKVSTGGSKDGETNKDLSTSAQDPNCQYRTNMCDACGHDTFTVNGLEWKKK
ncbi:hypothetical protein BOTNAR_0719g00040 [Botryotinia narcissicola]|uniref:Uncharacterized protein n=1 Tax=Botryotinia narcissicola TaxID=278944 RepID=A0A4Z1HIU8_9HELO|nr:hypothetical protein BOTNAR_0719g00040 [Botryotinia narcissicola]